MQPVHRLGPLSALSTGPLLGIVLDPGTPRGRAIERQLRERIRSGVLLPGTRLPSTRALAADLAVSRGVVVGAYDQLAAEGYLVLRRGATAEVAAVARVSGAGPPRRVHDVQASWFRFNLRPDLPDLSLFPRGDWLKATRAALRDAADTDLAYGEPFGAYRLRAALAPFLARTRGVVADTDRLGVALGSTHALYALGCALREGGALRIGVEDPGHRWRRQTLSATGLEVVPLPVDEHGLVTGALARARLDAAVVSPDHGFPFGSVLAPERRRELIAWARGSDALVIEHDYDGHFRYDRPPAGALQSLDPERVAYVGSASALLAPSLRLGWLVLPQRLVEPIASVLAETTIAAPRLLQHAFAEFIEAGYLDRHLRRMRIAYKQRFALTSRLLRTEGAPAGLYVRVPLRHTADEAAVLALVRESGFTLDGVNQNSTRAAAPALVVGFGAASAPTLEQALKRLRTLIRPALP
jgi:GntR family transcriptional regulator / MocR family aminotransferase